MNHEHIQQVAAVFDAAPRLTEIEVRSAGIALRLRRAAPSMGKNVKPAAAALSPASSLSAVAAPASVSAPVAEETEETIAAEGNTLVTSHMVGIFRAHARTGTKAAVPADVGDTVTEDQSLGSVETMRILNDCTAPLAGVLHAVFVEDGQPVEYGQALFEIAPASPGSLPVTES